MSLADNMKKVGEKVAQAAQEAGRDPQSIRIVAVGKTHPAARIKQVYDLGIRDIGENYVQEALQKMESLFELDIRWHMIGHLQTNKVKKIANCCELIHSVDSEKLVREISKHSSRVQKILIEVNLAGEKSKSGCHPNALPSLLDFSQALPAVVVQGLMFMPPPDLSEFQQRTYFAKARKLRDETKSRLSAPHHLDELSMGTTQDFEAAIKEGATLVRIGTALLGERS